MKILTLVFVLAFAIQLSVSSHGQQTESNQKEINKKAFFRAQSAAKAQTWTAALKLLKSIDVDTIDDADVVTYVDFSTRCAQLAEDLGIDRKSDPSQTKATLSQMDFAKPVSTMCAVIKEKGLKDSAKIAVEARRVQKQVPMYLELDNTLNNRYPRTPTNQ